MRCLSGGWTGVDVSVGTADSDGDIDEDDYNLLYDNVAGVGP